MTIKFLKDHTVQSIPPEVFQAEQSVSDRSPESERHFVSRGVAAYERDGKLFDIDGKEVFLGEVTQVVVVNSSDNRTVPDHVTPAGFGTMADGTPQRASSGPGEVVMTTKTAKRQRAAEPVETAKK